MRMYKLVGHETVPLEESAFGYGTISEVGLFDPTYRRVAQTFIEGYNVSTVFLVLDHNFSHDGPPILFETMVFGPDDYETMVFGPDDYETCERCSTWEQAEEQHERIVDRLRDKLKCQQKFGFDVIRGQDALRNSDTNVGRVVPQIDFRLRDTAIDECRRRLFVSLSFSGEEAEDDGTSSR